MGQQTHQLAYVSSSVGCVLHACCIALLQVRQNAGLQLKRSLAKQYASTTEDFRSYIKVCQQQLIRN